MTNNNITTGELEAALLKLPFVKKTPGVDIAQHPTKIWSHRETWNLNYFTIHQEAGRGTLEDIARYHVGPNHISQTGCPTFCYHFFVDFDGTIYKCNSLYDITWSNGKVRLGRRPSNAEGLRLLKGMNTEAINACVRGDFTGENHKGSDEPTDAQKQSVKTLINWAKNNLKIHPQNIIGHCHITPRACPGYVLTDLLEKEWSSNSIS
jgi:hypothetical protein